MPSALHHKATFKSLTLKDKIANLESCLKKIKKNDAKKLKEHNDTLNCDLSFASSKKDSGLTPVEKVKEKRKPGRPGKKKINVQPFD